MNDKQKRKPGKVFAWGLYLLGGYIVFSMLSDLMCGVPRESESVTVVELSPEEKAAKAMADSLEQAKRDSAQIVVEDRIQKGERSLNSLRSKEDEFQGLTFYNDKRSPRYSNVNFIYPYNGKKGSRYFLRLKFQYEADDWLFIRNIQLLIDGDKYTLNGKWERDNSGGRIWETCDIACGKEEVALLMAIASSDVAKVRYNGDKYYKDRKLTWKEKDIMKKITSIYNDLNAQNPYVKS